MHVVNWIYKRIFLNMRKVYRLLKSQKAFYISADYSHIFKKWPDIKKLQNDLARVQNCNSSELR